MSFDKTILETNFIDAMRSGNKEEAARLALRLFCDFSDDAIVYMPKGVGKTLQEIIETPKATTYRHLESLERRSIFTKIDEFSLQLNDQFSSKITKPVKYKGSRLILNQAELALSIEMDRQRAESWELRGKNKRHTKKPKEDENMNALIQALTKQLDVMDRQLSVKDQQIQEMIKLVTKIANGEGVSVKEARTKLELVKK